MVTVKLETINYVLQIQYALCTDYLMCQDEKKMIGIY